MTASANGAETAFIPPAAIAQPNPAAEAEARQTAAARQNTMVALAGPILMALIVLAVAIWAFLAFRRRRPPEARAALIQSKREAEAAANSTPPNEAVRTAPVMAAPVTAATASTPSWTEAAPARHTKPLVDSTASGDGPVSLPTELPRDFEERDALLKQLVLAKPDRANPFHSHKARVRRARLILQSLGRKFERRDPWIDLSQYTRNWPALAGRKFQPA